VQRTFSLLHELFGSTAQDERASLALGNAGEEVVPFTSDLKYKKIKINEVKRLKAW
jgi:hypothetical protein